MRAILLALVTLASACSSDRAAESAVVVGLLSPDESRDLPFLVADPAFECDEALSHCLTSGDAAVKWGTGFCEDTQAALESQLANGSVELFVDGRKIETALISQRDERYQRPDKGYCHTWLVKLAHWTSGGKVKLRSAIKYGDGGTAGEETEVAVKPR